jgi:hypothetical protein
MRINAAVIVTVIAAAATAAASPAAAAATSIELQSGFVLPSQQQQQQQQQQHAGPRRPCSSVAQPCPSHPGRTFCESDPAPGQCDDPMPHKPCPPCPAPSDDSGPPKTTGASVWSLDIVPPSAKSDYIVCNSRACRDGVAIKHGAVISSSVERAPLLDDGGTGHAGTPSWCSDPCPKGATALTSYWSDSLQDTLTTASKPPADGGYKSVHVEGYCLEDKPPLSSTLGASTQLLQYWSAARNDSFLVLKGGHWEAVAKQQGYVQRGAPECWALTPPPSSCRNGTDCGGTNLWTPWRSEPPDPSYTNPGAGMPVPRSSDILDWEYKSGANPGYGVKNALFEPFLH